MDPVARRWYVEIRQGSHGTEAMFGYESASLGHQIWDTVAWPLSLENWTETAILSELYDACLCFWEVRT